MAQLPISTSTELANTETVEETDGTRRLEDTQSQPTLHLRLEPPVNDRRVVFHDGVIDNEHMNRMKSKCCCIYKKPLAFGESSSEDDDECEHCYGHPEKRKKNKKPCSSSSTCPLPQRADQPTTSAEAQSQSEPATTDEVATAPTPDDFASTVKPTI